MCVWGGGVCVCVCDRERESVHRILLDEYIMNIADNNYKYFILSKNVVTNAKCAISYPSNSFM